MLNFPIDYQVFLTNFLEQQPLLMPAASSYSMDWNHLDEILQNMEPDEQSLQLFLKGEIPGNYFLDPSVEFGRQRLRINQYRFYEYLEHGASLVINRAENYSPLARELSFAIGKFSQQPTSSNFYISFYSEKNKNKIQKEETPFGKHWDTHDVFAIQLMGKKHWRLFPPTLPLPLSHQTSKQHQPPSSSGIDYVLNQGDILYIPRGWWHEVTPMEVDSVHLSLGTYAASLSDYILWALSRTLPQVIDARRGFYQQKDLAQILENIIDSVKPELCNQKNFADFMQHTQSRERLNGKFNTALTLGKNATSPLTDYRFTLTSVFHADQLEQDIRVNAGRLRLSPVSRAIIQTLSAQEFLLGKEIYAKIPQFTEAMLEVALLDLARHAVIRIDQPVPQSATSDFTH
jgi:ribosomal protein L16 Arg81 hydroxylase